VDGRSLTDTTELWGTRATNPEGRHRYVFAPLALDVDFTGGLLLGREQIADLGVNMGFQAGWKFTHVVEMVVQHGELQSRQDRSDQVASIREAIRAGVAADPDGERGGEAWVSRTFTLDYARTLGV
jgi:hypothetical protein